MREIPLPRALYYTCKGGKAIKKDAIGAFFASSNLCGLMLYKKERKFRTPRWTNQAIAANPSLRGSSSPVTYPSFARVFRAGATRLHFIPAHAGISSTRSVYFIACLGVGIAEDGSRARGDWLPLHQQRYCRCGVRLFHCAPWENTNAVSMLYISQ